MDFRSWVCVQQVIGEPLKHSKQKAVLSILASSMSHSVDQRVNWREGLGTQMASSCHTTVLLSSLDPPPDYISQHPLPRW